MTTATRGSPAGKAPEGWAQSKTLARIAGRVAVLTCLGLRREAKRHAAFMRTEDFVYSYAFRAGESAVAAPVFAWLRRGKALCRRSP